MGGFGEGKETGGKGFNLDKKGKEKKTSSSKRVINVNGEYEELVMNRRMSRKSKA